MASLWEDVLPSTDGAFSVWKKILFSGPAFHFNRTFFFLHFTSTRPFRSSNRLIHGKKIQIMACHVQTFLGIHIYEMTGFMDLLKICCSKIFCGTELPWTLFLYCPLGIWFGAILNQPRDNFSGITITSAVMTANLTKLFPSWSWGAWSGVALVGMLGRRCKVHIKFVTMAQGITY